MTQHFFYDKQIQRYLLQFIRIFSIFSVQKGYDAKGAPVLERVPARYGDVSRNTAHILKENSENFLNTVPFISCYITNLDMNDQWRTYPQQQRHANVIEKKFDSESQTYLEEDGQSYTVTRHAPVPYKLTMNVDIWTSNTDQKLQLLEQMLVLFNPTIDLYSDSNILDPSRLAYLKLLSTNWTSRTVPAGTDEIIDISTLQFEMIIHINPPLKVSRLNVIQTIISQISSLDGEEFEVWTAGDFDEDTSDFVLVTLGNYWVEYEDGKITLLKNGGVSIPYSLIDSNEDDVLENRKYDLTWKEDVFNHYGELKPGVSQIRLRQEDDGDIDDVGDPSNDIVGTIEYDPNDAIKLIFTPVDENLTDEEIEDIEGIYKQGFFRIYI